MIFLWWKQLNILEYIFFTHIYSQDNLDGRRGKWIDVILEYDIDIKPTKLIKGQGLAKLMVESNFHALDINFLVAVDEQEEHVTPHVKQVFSNSL